MMAEGRLDVESLISHRIGIDEAESAYDLVSGNSPSLGILLQYPEDAVGVALRTVCLPHAESKTRKTREGEAARVSFVGSGNYATAILIPAFKSAAADLRIAASRSGVSGLHAARSFGFAETTTDTERVFADSTTNTVVITTRHNSHAGLVLKALSAGKNAFVEKPLCLTIAELGEIEALHSGLVNSGATPRLMVGFNRRFAPHIIRIKALLAGVPGPKAFVMTVNAGFLPADHWTQDADIGGGRVLGEGCHFVDLLRFLAGAPFSGHHMALMRSATGDTATIQLSFVDGSMGTVHYFANGSKSYPKERLEVFAAGRVLQMDNYRTLRGYGWAGFRKMRLWRQDKGQKACAAAFVQSIERGLPSPIPFDEILEVSRMTIHIAGAGLEKG
jgi:predicted dehydrogenase